MTLLEAIHARHAVRRYTDRRIEGDPLLQLQQTIHQCNREGNLRIQLCLDEPEAFSGAMARYGRFHNVRNYLALVGTRSKGLQERCGYYGEKIVLAAQQQGLNSCWVALTYKKPKNTTPYVVKPGETLLLVVALGYGETQGVPSKNKPLERLCRVSNAASPPPWFLRGVKAAQLAPTALNQQKFAFHLDAATNTVTPVPGIGLYTRTDLGIAKCHFEIGAGTDSRWHWSL